MKYLMYEIKNNINGKIYVGVHKTKVEDDGYMGSGKVIKAAIAKYGLENFTKTILERFETQAEMFEREKEFVNEEFLSREDVYNLRCGGFGGFDYVNKTGQNTNWNVEKRNASLSKSIRKKIDDDPVYLSVITKNIKSGLEKAGIIRKQNYPDGTWIGRNHSLETIEKMKKSSKGKREKDKNSQYGSMWITNGTENRKIKKDFLVPDGWIKGRILSRSTSGEVTRLST